MTGVETATAPRAYGELGDPAKAPSAAAGGRERVALAETHATRLLRRIHYNLSLDQSRGVVLGCRIGTRVPRQMPVLPLHFGVRELGMPMTSYWSLMTRWTRCAC